MCNLYSMSKVPEAVRRLFRVSSNRAVSFEPKDAIFPRAHGASREEGPGLGAFHATKTQTRHLVDSPPSTR